MQQPQQFMQQQFNSFTQMPTQSQMTGQFDAFQQAPQQPQAQQPQQAPPTVFQTTRPEEADFGGFESAAPVPAAPAKPATENKFAAFGGLVDLGGLTSKTEEDAKKQAAMAQSSGPTVTGNSFSGLDGFS